MKTNQTVTVNIEFDLTRFEETMKNLMETFSETTRKLVRFSKFLIEDAFVDTHGIARSDIKKIDNEGKDWYAYLYNGRKIKLDVRKL